jgi:hypothetical protein
VFLCARGTATWSGATGAEPRKNIIPEIAMETGLAQIGCIAKRLVSEDADG